MKKKRSQEDQAKLDVLWQQWEEIAETNPSLVGRCWRSKNDLPSDHIATFRYGMFFTGVAFGASPWLLSSGVDWVILMRVWQVMGCAAALAAVSLWVFYPGNYEPELLGITPRRLNHYAINQTARADSYKEWTKEEILLVFRLAEIHQKIAAITGFTSNRALYLLLLSNHLRMRVNLN